MTKHLDDNTSQNDTNVNTNLCLLTNYGGRRKTMKRRKLRNITGTKGRGTYLRDWSIQQPGYHERTVMMQRCGNKCFLGPKKTFPICSRNTCKINKKGVYAAYIRSREYETIRKNKGTSKYRTISAKARKLIKKSFL